MLPLKEKDKVIVGKLLASGCCARCVLRFCCIGVPDAYRHGRRETLRQLRAFVGAAGSRAEENHNCQNVAQLEPDRKRSRLESEEAADEGEDEGEDEGVCVVCLGVLQHLSDASQAVQIADAVKKEKYEVDALVLSISLPAQMCVRERSCWLHVKEDVRAKCGALGRRDVVQVKEAFKWIVQGPLARELGAVAVAAKSPLEVSVCFAHPETDADCHFLASTCPDCFKVGKNKQSAFTRMAVAKALEKIPDDKFLERSPRPPSRPGSGCAAPEVQCVHASVFVAGRYNKFCRSLPQTPWFINGQRRLESSVEELVAAPVLAAFGARGFHFSSSGREDVDVRTLGNGRPFALELLNPRKSRLSPESMKNVQQVINASSEKVRVRDLQMVGRDATSRMKEGEEGKTKSYRALVWTQKSIREDDVAFINRIELHQGVCPRRLWAHKTKFVSATRHARRHTGTRCGVRRRGLAPRPARLSSTLTGTGRADPAEMGPIRTDAASTGRAHEDAFRVIKGLWSGRVQSRFSVWRQNGQKGSPCRRCACHRF